MNSSTSNSKLLLIAALVTLVVIAFAVQLIDKSYIHTGPEYAMSEAVRERVDAVCKEKHVDLVIVGDSRAVAAIESEAIRKQGLSVEKFALGGSGVFVGWAILDELSRCPVKIDNVLASYGTIHVVTPGALMERTTNYTFLHGAETAPAYKFLSQTEPRKARAIAYGAISMLGTKLTLTDLVLQRPAIKTILQKPAHALGNRDWYLRERAFFAAKHADVYYGEFPHVVGLPEEEKLTGTAIAIDPVSRASILGIAEIARRKHYRAMLYIAPVSDLAWAKLEPAVFARTEDFIALAQGNGIEALNRAWSLPIDHFGDPSHVNSRGRAAVMADLMPRLKAHLDLPKTQAAP